MIEVTNIAKRGLNVSGRRKNSWANSFLWNIGAYRARIQVYAAFALAGLRLFENCHAQWEYGALPVRDRLCRI